MSNESPRGNVDAPEFDPQVEAGALLDSLLENCLDYIYFKDLQSRFVRYSRSLAEHFNVLTPEGLKGKTDFDCYSEARARSAFEDEQHIIQTGKPLIGKLEKGLRADGRTTWVLTSKMPWRNAQGAIVGTFGISKDVTALKQAEAELEQTGSLLETMLQHSPDRIYFKDSQSRFVRCSQALADHVRITDPALMRGKTDFDIFLKEHALAAYEDEQRIMQTGQPMTSKPEKETHPDGRTTWALTTKLPWRDKDGNIVGTFGTSKDITAIKEAEAKLEQMHRQLLETSRLAGMAEVAAGILHNVGNVLNSLNVSATLIAEQLQASRITQLSKATALLTKPLDELAQFITTDPKGKQLPCFLVRVSEKLTAERHSILSELAVLRTNIGHIRDVVARQEAYTHVVGVTEQITPGDLAEEALSTSGGSLLEHDIQVHREYSPNLPAITLDKHRALQILVELIRNAITACAASGRSDPQITLRSSPCQLGVRIEVIDNGLGIPPEKLTLIFQPGAAMRKDSHGFGLHSAALAAKEIGGTLLARSNGPGSGAAFLLELPLQPSPRATAKSTCSSANSLTAAD